jgi:hypothetical protein
LGYGWLLRGLDKKCPDDQGDQRGLKCTIIAGYGKQLLNFILDIAQRINRISFVSFDLILLLIILLVADRISLNYPAIFLNGIRRFIVLGVA